MPRAGKVSMDEAAMRRAADILVARRLQRNPVEPLPENCRPRDETDGYRVQRAVHEALAQAGRGTVVGYKIGCTTPVVQAYMGIGRPCAGGILSSGVYEERAHLRHADFVRVGVECEIAVHLAEDLAADSAPFTRDTAAGAVGACMAAIEIVDDRYRDFSSVGAPTLIADDFFGAGCVLGPPVADWRAVDLAAAVGTTRVNGVEAGQGTGGDVMGHPFEALAWLANLLAEQGKELRKGMIVLTGSIVTPKWVEPGDAATITLTGLGEVHVRFA